MTALDFISTLPIRMSDGDMTSFQIINQNVLLGAQAGGIRVVGIDYSELVPDRPQTRSEEQRVSGIYRNAQRLSRVTGSCVIVISQFPNEALSDPTKLGAVWMTRYSGSGFHAADVAAILYNPRQMRNNQISFQLPNGFDENSAYLVIGKNKEGKTGAIKLDWTPGAVRFADPRVVGFGTGTLYEGLGEVQEEIRGDF